MVLNHSFSVDQTSFLVRLLMVSFFPSLEKNSLIPGVSSFLIIHSFSIWQPLIGIAFTGGTGQTDSNCSFNQHDILQLPHGYIFLPYQPYTCKGRSIFLLSFQVLSKVCGMDPLLTEIFYILL